MRSKSHLVALALIAVLMVAGTAYSFYLGNNLRIWDEQQYTLLARNIVSKHTFSLDGASPTALWPPGYPVALAFLVMWGADVTALRVFNVLLLGATTWILYRWLNREADERAGLIGIGLVIAYPVLVYGATNLYPQTLGALTFVLALYLLTAPEVTVTRSLLAGLVLGYLILTIPTFVSAFLIIVAWLVVLRHRIRSAALVVLMALSLVGAWTLRNYAAFHTFVFVSTNSGFNLLVGNSAETTAASGLNINFGQFLVATSGMSEVQSDAYYRSRALDFIKGDLPRAARLYLYKVINYFNFRNDLVVQTLSPINPDILMFGSYGLLLLLFILRALSVGSYKLTDFEILLITLYLGNALVQAAFFTRIRFRLPFDFLLIAVDASFLYYLLGRTRVIRNG